MANDTIVLNGTNYLRLPITEDFYPNRSINIDFDLTLRSWTQPFSSQIIGNFDNQGYGVFYQNGIEEITDFTILDCGNSHLFHFNQDTSLISQRDFPKQDNPVSITAQTIDHFGNKYYYDSGNNLVYRLDTYNILKNSFSLQGTNFDIKIINVNSEGNVFFLNKAETIILEYTSLGTFVQTHALGDSYHNNFAITSADTVHSYITKENTPMTVDCEDNFYSIYGVNLYKNGVPWFHIGSNANTFGIDANDHIWIIRDGNELIKINTSGKILLKKIFHEIQPCVEDPCNTEPELVNINFTRELSNSGYEDFAWVLLGKTNYAIKLDGNADIRSCVLLTNLLDSTRYPNATFDRTQFCNNGDFTSFRHKKLFALDCGNTNNSYIIARVAIQDTCSGLVTVKTLTHNVTSLSGSHNIKFVYNGIDGQGKLFVDGVLEDSFISGGTIYYDPNSKTPTLIGADSGNFRAKKEELGIVNPTYLQGFVENVVLSKNIENFSQRKFQANNIKMEFPTTYPISYVSDVDHMFLFRPTGFASSQFNIIVKDSGFTSTEDQLLISKDILDIVEDRVPVQNVINKLEWKETVTLAKLAEQAS